MSNDVRPPRKIYRPKPYLLTMEYDDNFSATISLVAFRDECPCAKCKGETILGTTYTFGLQTIQPGMYELLSLAPVGNYAVEAVWRDGHNSGIYTWENLRAIAEKNALSEAELLELSQKESS